MKRSEEGIQRESAHSALERPAGNAEASQYPETQPAPLERPARNPETQPAPLERPAGNPEAQPAPLEHPSLYLVATPIGNLGDITLRALEVLRGVDAIACEDTRQTGKLLRYFGVPFGLRGGGGSGSGAGGRSEAGSGLERGSVGAPASEVRAAGRSGVRKPLFACHSYNEEGAGASRVLALLRAGAAVAYASDAGTPGLSDPGAVLVRRVRDAGFRVLPVPGASALTALVSLSGFGTQGFVFAGFLSPKRGRRRQALRDLYKLERPFILYESPHRIVKLLADCIDIEAEHVYNSSMESNSSVLAQRVAQRTVLCGRELTKLHEEVIEGSAEDILHSLEQRPAIKGEFVLLFSAPTFASVGG